MENNTIKVIWDKFENTNVMKLFIEKREDSSHLLLTFKMMFVEGVKELFKEIYNGYRFSLTADPKNEYLIYQKYLKKLEDNISEFMEEFLSKEAIEVELEKLLPNKDVKK